LPIRASDLLLTKGHIYTGNSKQPWAQAIAISGTRIDALGSNEEILKRRESKTKVVDLQGRTVTPGIVDSHTHLWMGALALHMARHHGVAVRACNISREQVRFARERARAEGLDGRVEFVEDDYRNVRGEYDAFVSVGMLEHVGLADYQTFGGVVDRSLTKDGRGLLHFIGRNQPGALNPWIRKRIFPGAYPPALPEVFERVLEPWNLSVLDVENLRLHYAATLQHWRRRFDAAAGEVARMFDDSFVRAWRLYLAGSQAAFTTGTMQLFQVLFARGSSNAIRWTRSS